MNDLLFTVLLDVLIEKNIISEQELKVRVAQKQVEVSNKSNELIKKEVEYLKAELKKELYLID
jgi:hypothetical protein